MTSVNKLELCLYGLVVGACFVKLAVQGYTFSLQFERGGTWEGTLVNLRQGWIFGREVDLSDTQWREFRSSLPILSLVFCVFGIASRLVRSQGKSGRSAMSRRILFVNVFSLVYLIYLHGICASYIYLLVYINWMLSRLKMKTPSLKVALCWVFNLATLVLVRITEGFEAKRVLGPSFAWLDSYRGVFRWQICFNLTMLRMISFWMDLYWREKEMEGKRTDREDIIDPKLYSPRTGRRTRRIQPLSGEDKYGLLPCFAHALYPPLYIAGPIITYNDFMWQMHLDSSDKVKNSPNSSWWKTNESLQCWKQILCYVGRLLLDILCIEAVTHFLYFNSIAVNKVGLRYKDSGLTYGAFEVAMTGWWVLSFMWLKFAVIWRFFRMASIIEGVDAPENMIRCFAMNYDVQGFWKGWHASFNQWLVRYMYLPAGGSKNLIYIIWPIFFFVAVWHDIDWRLLSWAWVMCLAFLPEILIKQQGQSSRWKLWREKWVFDFTCGIFAAINIAALMAANMAGFVVGLEGVGSLLGELIQSPKLVIISFASFYCAARLMFVYRSYCST